MTKFRFELITSIEVIVEGADREEARIGITDGGILQFIDKAELYVSEGVEVTGE